MAKNTILLILLCAAASFSQTTASSQSTTANQQPPKKTKDEITATGCVSKMNASFILMETGQSNSYQLQESKNVKVGPYLGQEVEVTGVESYSPTTSSPKASTASPITITVRSIKSIQKRCSAN